MYLVVLFLVCSGKCDAISSKYHFLCKMSEHILTNHLNTIYDRTDYIN